MFSQKLQKEQVDRNAMGEPEYPVGKQTPNKTDKDSLLTIFCK